MGTSIPSDKCKSQPVASSRNGCPRSSAVDLSQSPSSSSSSLCPTTGLVSTGAKHSIDAILGLAGNHLVAGDFVGSRGSASKSDQNQNLNTTVSSGKVKHNL